VGHRALLVNVDTMSRTLGESDYGNQVLFGDGATATALETDTAASSLTFTLSSDGRGTEAVCLPHSGMSASPAHTPEFVINGPAVLALGLRSVPRLVKELLDASGLQLGDIGLFVPHQANQFILDKLAERLPLERSRMLSAMRWLGNTSSASIPLALCAKRTELEGLDLQRVMMVGFGTGFSLSGVVADLTGTHITDPVEVA
jgi:3-oxoacyl-[acyl-carrier-protein] synthase-3